jgi:hypothetical protein
VATRLHIAQLYSQLKPPQRSHEVEELRIAIDNGNPSEKAVAQIVLANIYQKSEPPNFKAAIELLDQAVASGNTGIGSLPQQQDRAAIAALAHLYLGDVYRQMRPPRKRKSEEHFQKVIAFCQSDNISVPQMAGMGSRFATDISPPMFEQSEHWIKEGVQRANRTGDVEGASLAHSMLGDVYRMMEPPRLQDAISEYTQAAKSSKYADKMKSRIADARLQIRRRTRQQH